MDADGAIYVKEVDDPHGLGVAQIEGDRITRLIEKPDSMDNNLAVAGVYYLREVDQLFSAIEELMERGLQTKGEFYLADALQLMIDRGAHIVVEPVDVWQDCGKPETLLHTNRYLLDKGLTRIVPVLNSVIVPPVYINDGATIENSIVGPYVSVGPGSAIRNAVIRNSILESNTRINGVALEESLIGDGAQVSGNVHRLNVGASSEVRIG